MEQVRSFIAIELPDEVKTALYRLETLLKSGKQHSLKWINPNNIHLTLKFLGSVAVDRMAAITGAIEDAAVGITPFRLEVSGLGAFPNLNRVQVVWVGVGGEIDRLCHLQQRLESNLARLGFAQESRPFKPHLTLARFRDQATSDERQSFGRLVAGTRFESTHIIKVDTINLMKSQLTREGAIYSRISSARLNKPLSTTDI